LKKLMSVGKKLNKKDLLSSNLATKKGYCTQRIGACSSRGLDALLLNIAPQPNGSTKA